MDRAVIQAKIRRTFGDFAYLEAEGFSGHSVLLVCPRCQLEDGPSSREAGRSKLVAHLRSNHPVRYWLGRALPASLRPRYT